MNKLEKKYINKETGRFKGGKGERFDNCVKYMKEKGSSNPEGLCASIGRKKGVIEDVKELRDFIFGRSVFNDGEELDEISGTDQELSGGLFDEKIKKWTRKYKSIGDIASSDWESKIKRMYPKVSIVVKYSKMSSQPGAFLIWNLYYNRKEIGWFMIDVGSNRFHFLHSVGGNSVDAYYGGKIYQGIENAVNRHMKK